MIEAVRMSSSEQIYYLYGITNAGRALPRQSEVALEGITGAGLQAIVEPVSAEEFAPDALETKLQCLETVERMARKHNAVVTRAVSYGSTIPARLCTLFSGPEAIRSYLDKNHGWMTDALRWVGGCLEWGLKVYCDESAIRARISIEDSRAQSLARAAEVATDGRAYLLHKRMQTYCAEAASARIDGMLDEILDQVEPRLVDARPKPLQPESAGDPRRPMVVNLVVLVEADQIDSFCETVDDLALHLADQGMSFELSGPWPPYSFCDRFDLVENDSRAEGKGAVPSDSG